MSAPEPSAYRVSYKLAHGEVVSSFWRHPGDALFIEATKREEGFDDVTRTPLYTLDAAREMCAEIEKKFRSTEAAMDAYTRALHALQAEIVAGGDGEKYGIAMVSAKGRAER